MIVWKVVKTLFSACSGQKEPSPGPADEQPAACRLSVERQIPGDDSGGSGEPATLTVNREFIREQAPGKLIISENI